MILIKRTSNFVMPYNTAQFLDEIKKEIESLVGKSVNNIQISKILTGHESRHFESKKTEVKRSLKSGRNYLISMEVLKEYKENLKKEFDDNYRKSSFNEIFRKYRQNNKLNEYIRSTLNYNPKLNLSYFERIDSKEKAYWLGWIFAEGHLNRYGGIQVEIGIRDEVLVLKFAKAIGFEQDNIIYKIRKRNEVPIRTCLITFQNSQFVEHLLHKGLVQGKKSDVIVLPNLGEIRIRQVRGLYLAFLLGYFDGDGTQGSSRIHSNSFQFLYQIKSIFKLKSKISQMTYITKKGIKKRKYSTFLTAPLFNEMLNNYKLSLKRKRIKLVDSVQRVQQLAKARENRKIKLRFNKKELQKLLFEMSKSKIAILHEIRFGIRIGRTTVYRYFQKWDLTMPSENFWRRKKSLKN